MSVTVSSQLCSSCNAVGSSVSRDRQHSSYADERGMGRERHSIYGTNRRLGADNSHSVSFAMQPLEKHDYEQNRIYEKKYLEYQYQLEMSRK